MLPSSPSSEGEHNTGQVIRVAVVVLHIILVINLLHKFPDNSTVVRGQTRNATTQYVSIGTDGKRKTRATRRFSFRTPRNHLRARIHTYAGRLRKKAYRRRPQHHRQQKTIAHRPQQALLQGKGSPSPDRILKAPLQRRQALANHFPEQQSSHIL